MHGHIIALSSTVKCLGGPIITLDSTNNCSLVPSSNLHDVHLPQKSTTVKAFWYTKSLVTLLMVLRPKIPKFNNNNKKHFLNLNSGMDCTMYNVH